ncbi:MAG: diphthine synthase [Thermoplasmata archaeon]|nr:diphthine synthase [Thermoplasmata archaeon]
MSKLYFIGLGLFDERDISLKGLDAIKSCDSVFAEFYTASLAGTTLEKLEQKSGKNIKILTREEVEQSDKILKAAKKHNVAFICQGDPLTATTHIELLLQAQEAGVATEIIHGASIAIAVPGLLGLQYYKFGRTTTIAYPQSYSDGEYLPESPYYVILENKKRGLHTLVLLDIVAVERRYMTADEGIEILLAIESKCRKKLVTPSTLICVVARAGSLQPLIRADYIKNLQNEDFGVPLHSLVIPGELHFKEAEALVKLANAPRKILK